MIQPEAIDFEKMKKEEMERAAKVYTFKQSTREDLYNILQDFRHVVMFDLRPFKEFYALHIRDSFSADEIKGNENKIVRYLEDAEKKHKENEQKYNIKPIRRAFIIDSKEKTYSENDEKTKFVINAIKKFGGFDKVLYLKQGFEHFFEKYPFLCLNFNERDQVKENEKQKGEESKAEDKPILNDFEKKMFYAFSRFPTEIIEGKLFLGSVNNANNKPQLKDLGIKSIMEFISYKDTKPLEHKTTDYVYKNIPCDNDIVNFIDFNEVCKSIDEIMTDESKLPLLIVCSDGDTYSPCFAIAYLMWHKKLSLTLASVSVYQKRGTAEANKNLYTNLTTWQPQGIAVGNKSIPGWFKK